HDPGPGTAWKLAMGARRIERTGRHRGGGRVLRRIPHSSGHSVQCDNRGVVLDDRAAAARMVVALRTRGHRFLRRVGVALAAGPARTRAWELPQAAAVGGVPVLVP